MGKKIISIKGASMQKQTFRPVLIGLFFGVCSLIFGILWAAYLTLNHDHIHKVLGERAKAALEEKFVLSGSGGHRHGGENNDQGGSPSQAPGHDHKDGHDGGEAVSAAHSHDVQAGPHEHAGAEPAGMNKEAHEHRGGHDEPGMEEAHERLTRGHLHAMGLGTVSIALSFMIAFLPAPHKMKTFASACLGVGGFFYPMAWIIMGYRTTALGAEAAQESVLPIVAFSVSLVLAGLILCLFYLFKAVFQGE